MASSGNTWCKKLMAKGKKNALGYKLGTFQRMSLSSTLDEVKAPKEREYFAPVKREFVPANVKSSRRGCKLNAKTRAAIQARLNARDAFVAALRTQPRA